MPETQQKSDVVESQIETVRNAESLGETQFSALFHEARTANRRISSVVVQVRVRDGEFEVHESPVKTRQGEHLRGTSSWDGKVSLPTKSFMETSVGRSEIVRQLKDLQRNYIARDE